jgi:8-oxo-dGTP pyrophosphatase MutT (NUDIX family)
LLTELAALKTRLSARTSSSAVTPDAMQTSVALILTPGARGLDALFIRRALRADDPWSGHIALPGGRREPGDSDLLATAVRETREEVGISLPAACLLGALDDLAPRTPRLPPLMIRPYVFGLDARPDAGVSEEVAESMWMPLQELSACAAATSVMIQGTPVEVPCFNRNGVVIWGLTYRILLGFLPLVSV